MGTSITESYIAGSLPCGLSTATTSVPLYNLQKDEPTEEPVVLLHVQIP